MKEKNIFTNKTSICSTLKTSFSTFCTNRGRIVRREGCFNRTFVVTKIIVKIFMSWFAG